MLSENGFKMHLGNIRHSTNMYNVHGGGANLKSAENSEEVLLKNFQEQQKIIDQMKQYIKNGIRWGYIDDREMEYKKFIE